MTVEGKHLLKRKFFQPTGLIQLRLFVHFFMHLKHKFKNTTLPNYSWNFSKCIILLDFTSVCLHFTSSFIKSAPRFVRRRTILRKLTCTVIHPKGVRQLKAKCTSLTQTQRRVTRDRLVEVNQLYPFLSFSLFFFFLTDRAKMFLELGD